MLSVKNPLFPQFFTPCDTPFFATFEGIFFANMGVGVVEIVFTLILSKTLERRCSEYRLFFSCTRLISHALLKLSARPSAQQGRALPWWFSANFLVDFRGCHFRSFKTLRPIKPTPQHYPQQDPRSPKIQVIGPGKPNQRKVGS